MPINCIRLLIAAALLVIALPGIGSEREVRNSIALGALAFADNCQKCHQADGYGEEGLYPSLHNAALLADKEILIKTVLYGRMSHMEGGDDGGQRLMPSLSFLTDREIADIIAFISNSWGEDVLLVTPEEVQKAR